MAYLFIFIPGTIAVWVLVAFVMSRVAWARLASHYPAGDYFGGTRIGIISLAVNLLSYNNCVIMKYNDDGLYLKTIFFMRLFHKPLLIPWKEIKEVNDKRLHFFDYKEMVIGSPTIARLGIRKKTFTKIENTWSYYSQRD